MGSDYSICVGGAAHVGASWSISAKNKGQVCVCTHRAFAAKANATDELREIINLKRVKKMLV